RPIRADHAACRERQRARRQPGVTSLQWRGAVALRPGGGEEQSGDQKRVQPERLAEEEELRGEAEQRSERDRGNGPSFEHEGSVRAARVGVIARERYIPPPPAFLERLRRSTSKS